MRRYLVPVLIILIILAGIGGYLIGRTELKGLQRQIIKLTDERDQIQEEASQVNVELFFIKATAKRLYLKPVLKKVKLNGSLAETALSALFEGPEEDSGLTPVFPDGTEVIGVTIKHRLATVNLNRTTTELNVGAEGEILAIASIVNTLTKLPEIDAVKILIEGEELESLAGHVDLTQTFRYNSNVVEDRR